MAPNCPQLPTGRRIKLEYGLFIYSFFGFFYCSIFFCNCGDIRTLHKFGNWVGWKKNGTCETRFLCVLYLRSAASVLFKTVCARLCTCVRALTAALPILRGLGQKIKVGPLLAAVLQSAGMRKQPAFLLLLARIQQIFYCAPTTTFQTLPGRSESSKSELLIPMRRGSKFR